MFYRAFGITLFAALSATPSPSLGQTNGDAATGEIVAIAHDGLPIYFEVHGKGDKFLMLGSGTAVPRLSWIGDADQPTLNGDKLTHMGEIVVRTRPELEAAGWDVRILPGRNHLDAAAPDVQVPLIKNWLKKVYR